MKKPEPKPTAIVCTLCGLGWDRHEKLMKTKTEKPTAETCVELLKADLAARPRYAPAFSGTGITWPANYTVQ
jgi:hypothetical protein